MGPWAQQDHRPAGALTVAAIALALAAGCDSPPRARPWRHAPDPIAVAQHEAPSPALADEGVVSELRANRDHTLRIQMDAEPRQLEPMLNPSVWTRRITMGPIFETLIRYAPPEHGAGSGPGRYVPGLARSWRITGDGTDLYFELQPGVTFHDGQPMSAADVQFSLDTARDPRKGADHLWPLLADIKTVEKVSPRMVHVELTRPDGWVLRAIAEVPILPWHVYQNSLTDGGKLIGTGPWRLESWKAGPGGVVHLTRNDRYWGPAPAIRDLEFVYQPDAARALLDAKRGDLDLIPAMIPAHWPEQASSPGIASAFRTIQLRPPRFRYLVLDTTAPPFDDARVRRAVALLVDRKGLCKDYEHNLARPVGGPVWPGGPADGAAPPPPDFDPGAAARLLDDAGWTDADKDGLREQGAEHLKMTLLLVDPAEPPAPGHKLDPEREHLVDAFRKAGFVVEIKLGPEAVIMKRLAEGKFGASLLEWDGAVDSDLSRWLETGGRANVGKVSSHRLDAIFAAMRNDWDPAARVAQAGELAAAIADEEPIVAISAPDPEGLIHRRVRGAVPWDGWLDLAALSLDGGAAAGGDAGAPPAP